MKMETNVKIVNVPKVDDCGDEACIYARCWGVQGGTAEVVGPVCEHQAFTLPDGSKLLVTVATKLAAAEVARIAAKQAKVVETPKVVDVAKAEPKPETLKCGCTTADQKYAKVRGVFQDREPMELYQRPVCTHEASRPWGDNPIPFEMAATGLKIMKIVVLLRMLARIGAPKPAATRPAKGEAMTIAEIAAAEAKRGEERAARDKEREERFAARVEEFKQGTVKLVRPKGQFNPRDTACGTENCLGHREFGGYVAVVGILVPQCKSDFAAACAGKDAAEREGKRVDFMIVKDARRFFDRMYREQRQPRKPVRRDDRLRQDVRPPAREKAPEAAPATQPEKAKVLPPEVAARLQAKLEEGTAGAAERPELSAEEVAAMVAEDEGDQKNGNGESGAVGSGGKQLKNPRGTARKTRRAAAQAAQAATPEAPAALAEAPAAP